MALYDEVLSALRAANGIAPDDDGAFALHLGTLVPALHELRASYRTGLGTVEVSYTRALTEAYLLAYYPHYVSMTWSALNLLPKEAFDGLEDFSLCAFAPGPAPEPVAVGRYLAEHLPGVANFEVSLLDLASKDWDWAQSISIGHVLPKYWTGGTLARTVDAVDFTQPGLVAGTAGAAEGADLVVFQNCLNEIAAGDVQFRENISELVGAMKSGSVLLMADVVNYPTAVEHLDAIAASIDGRVSWLRRPGERLFVQPLECPPILRNNFFVGGEYPRRYPFEWRCLAVQV